MDEQSIKHSDMAAETQSKIDVLGRPGWCDAGHIADELRLTTAPSDRFGFAGWISVMMGANPVRHFPSQELADAFIQGSDRTYTLAEMAEACTVAYARGLAMGQLGERSIALGDAGASMFASLKLPGLLARIEWVHEGASGEPGWQLSERQEGSALGELADRESQWQAFLTAVDDMVAWLATQTTFAWPSALARALTTTAAPLRSRNAKATITNG